MGQFIAFDAETDERVVEIGEDLESYYRFILEQEFPGIPLEETPDNFDTKYALSVNDRISYDYYKDTLGDSPRFYIPGNNHSSRDVRSVLAHIADQENKYYYAWVEDSMNPMPTQVEGVRVLDKLNRVNALVFYNINDEKKGNWKTYEGDWNSQNNYFGNQKATIPIWVASYIKQSGDGPQKYFGVFVKSGFSFFLDTNEEGKFYQFQKQEQLYRSILTEKPGEMPGGFLVEDKLVYSKAWRKVYGLYLYRQFLVQKGERGRDDDFIKTRQLGSVIAQFSMDPNGAEQEFLNNFTEEEQKVAAKEFADNYAKLLPPSFKCFYFRGANAGELQGFLSSVNTGEGRRGSGGYAMRADKVSEVNYLWGYNQGISQTDSSIAFLLSHVMGLEPQYRVNTYPNQNYFPTNWPVEAQVYEIKTPVPKGNTSWFTYFKQFNGSKRRNLPAKPGPPRISGYQSQDYPHTFDTKSNGSTLNNRSYRIWKKGDAFGGIALGDGTAKDRASAGSVMASALSEFTFDQGAGFPKSSLSATQFTGQMIQLDEKIKAQWSIDNGASTNPSLQTDQEWCHLLGHGDGGPEELGNFMAGSKHCNTEQLAIEVGQRRITHNDDIPKDIKAKFKAKITAYLFPNNGAWTDQVLTEAELRKKFGLAERYEEAQGKRKLSESNDSIVEKVFQEWLPKFFKEEDTKAGEYVLNTDLVANSFKSLSDKLKELNGEEKISLFQFRQNLERHFFQYLPIGRWMRYKIFYDGKKIFDHVYDAQSQSFNYHEAQILDYTLERILYQALQQYEKNFQLKTEDTPETLSYWQYYKRKTSDRVAALVPNEGQAEKLANRKELFDLSIANQNDALLTTKVIELLKDMRSRPRTDASEAAKAKKLIGDFRIAFEDVFTRIEQQGILSAELKQVLQSAVHNSDGLYKEIIGQLELAQIYKAFRLTLG